MARIGEKETNKSGPRIDPVEWLRSELVRRKRKNPYYSLRSFSRQLGIPAASLSEILSRKRGFTRKMAERVAQSLSLTSVEKRRLFYSVEYSLGLQKDLGRNCVDEPAYEILSDDVFNLVSDWYHYSILALLQTTNFQSSEKYIAQRLGISIQEVKVAIERMSRLGLVHKKGNRLQSVGNLSSTLEIPSEAVRRYHHQLLQRADRSLEECRLQERDITSITIAVDASKLPQAKKMIQRFRRKVAKFLETGNPTEVFHLNVQLFPATRKYKS